YCTYDCTVTSNTTQIASTIRPKYLLGCIFINSHVGYEVNFVAKLSQIGPEIFVYDDPEMSTLSASTARAK
ncbi:hypothetical protein A9R01_01095, partial ['Osedax' symbiont bacterium Rs2_46_30_T18]